MLTEKIQSRSRSQLDKLTNSDLADLITDYNAFEIAKCAETDRTYTVMPSLIFFDGANYNCVILITWLEITDEAGGLPEGV